MLGQSFLPLRSPGLHKGLGGLLGSARTGDQHGLAHCRRVEDGLMLRRGDALRGKGTVVITQMRRLVRRFSMPHDQEGPHF